MGITLVVDMLRRLRLLLVVLGAGLAALTLSGAVDAGRHEVSPGGKVGDGAFAVRASRIDGAALRLTGEDRRDASVSERALKQRFVVFAVAAALVGVPALWRRRAAELALVGSAQLSRWSPRSGRAPPLLSS